MLEDYKFILALLICGGIALWRWYFSKDARTRRALRAVHQVPIKDVQDGSEIRISGRAEPLSKSLSAPLSGRACFCWEVVVEEYQPIGGRSGRWVELIREQDATTFCVVDGSGTAIVKARCPQMALHQDGKYQSGMFDNTFDAFEEYLMKHGHSSTGLLGLNKKLRYREGVVEQGEHVCVCGRGLWVTDPDGGQAGYRDRPRKLTIEDPNNGPMLISDST